jgi:DNA-directed RNA polymerase specialized sigma24 family protein
MESVPNAKGQLERQGYWQIQHLYFAFPVNAEPTAANGSRLQAQVNIRKTSDPSENNPNMKSIERRYTMNLLHLICPSKHLKSTNALKPLHIALDELHPLQRAVLHLRFWENQEISEIARLTRRRWTDIDRLIESTLLELRYKCEKIEANAA